MKRFTLKRPHQEHNIEEVNKNKTISTTIFIGSLKCFHNTYTKIIVKRPDSMQQGEAGKHSEQLTYRLSRHILYIGIQQEHHTCGVVVCTLWWLSGQNDLNIAIQHDNTNNICSNDN